MQQKKLYIKQRPATGTHRGHQRFKPAVSQLLMSLLFMVGCNIFQAPVLHSQPAVAKEDGASLLVAEISFVLRRIERQQELAIKDPVFLAGSYPSYIHHRRHFKQKKKDITIFYNILIDMTLKKVRPALPDSLQTLIDTLLTRSGRLYPRFYNQNRGSYNFWLRDSSYRFPYSWWIPMIKKNGAVPDDMDDSVLARFIDPKGNKDSLEKFHQILQDFVRRKDQPLRSAPRAYRHFYTYSTWFGQNFPVVLDAVVLSNILSFVSHYQLDWTRADSAALHLIAYTIKSKDYIRRPLAIAPYYGKTAILLYHYARLMAENPLPILDSLRPELIQTCRQLLSRQEAPFMEKVITANALMLLDKAGSDAAGQNGRFRSLPLQLPVDNTAQWETQVEHSDFAYFIGNIPSYMSRTFQGILNPVNALMYYHYCPAFNDALVLQYLSLQKEGLLFGRHSRHPSYLFP